MKTKNQNRTHKKTIAQVISALEKRAPSSASESWDNTGLLIGDPEQPVSSVVISDDLTEHALQLAIQKKSKLILLHHPPIFPKQKGISKLVLGQPHELSTLMIKAIQNSIAIAAFHTNFDRCALEVVEDVSKALGCTPMGRLFDQNQELLKLVVFVPQTHTEKVREALGAAGAGSIGNYDQCSFVSEGQGSFRAKAGAKPFLGKLGKLEKVKEHRLETVFVREIQNEILEALRMAHPYEEIAYDIYGLDQPIGKTGITRGAGYGFWGEFEKPISVELFTQRVMQAFEIKTWLETAGPVSKINRVAFSAGKGSSFVGSALKVKADVFVTGEVGYHRALDGSRKGLRVIELGHRESEKFFLKTMSQWITQLGLSVAISDEPTQRFCKNI